MKQRRILILLAIVFAVATQPIYAQGGGMRGGMGGGMRGGMRGGMGGGPQGGTMQQRVKLNPENVITSLGLFIIDPDPIVKRCKIKEEATISSLNSILSEYSREYDNIMFEHAPQIDSIKNMNNKASGATEALSSSALADMRARMAMVRTVREKATAMHKKMNEKVTEILNEKEQKRWKVYYEALCSENYFNTKTREGRGNGERPQGGGMRSGGMNGGMGGNMGGGMDDMGDMGDMGGY